jgi:hypothetical protein
MTFEENSDGTLTAATGLATLPGPSDPKATLVHWNNTLVNLSGTIYIYGSDDSSRTYVAKIAASALPYGFLGSWNLSFFSSGSWVPDQSKATPISKRQFRSVRVVNGYLLAAHRNNGYESAGEIGVTRTSPSDPQFQAKDKNEQCFANDATHVTAPGATAAGNVSNPKYSAVKYWTYCPTLHPELMPSNGSQLLMSIDWNTLDDADYYKDAELYKPRFFTIPAPNSWPASKPCDAE